MASKLRNVKGIHRQYQNRRNVLERRLSAAYHTGIKFVLKTVSGKLKSGLKAIPSQKEIEKTFIKLAKNRSKNIYTSAFLFGFQDVEKLYGDKLPVMNMEKRIDIEKDLSMEDLIDTGLTATSRELNDIALKKMKIISQSFRDTMVITFDNSIKEGMNTNAIAEALRGAVSDLQTRAPFIAKRIARTETTRIFSRGSLDSYKKSTVVRKKGWSPDAGGAGHRAWHIQQEVPIDENFIVGSEELECPGDPNGSAENVINCVCGLYPVIS